MKPTDIARAWTDPEFRREHVESGGCPDHPSGWLSEPESDADVHGGTGWWCVTVSTIVATLAMNCTASQTYCRGTCDAGGSSGCCS